MATYEEIEEVLTKSIAASKELRAVTADAHAAKKDLDKAVKDNKARIEREILDAAQEAVANLTDVILDEMRAKVTEVIAGIEKDWRAKLGLEGS